VSFFKEKKLNTQRGEVRVMLKRNYFKLTTFVLIGIFLLSFSGYAVAGKKEVKKEGVFVGGELITDQQTYQKAIKEGELQFYTAHTLSQDKKMVAAFMKLFPEIKVVITRAAGATLNEKMLTEQAAGVLKADVVINSDRNYLNDFYTKGWLLKHMPPSDAKFPASSKEAGYYYPTGASAIIMAYHQKLCWPLESTCFSVQDLSIFWDLESSSSACLMTADAVEVLHHYAKKTVLSLLIKELVHRYLNTNSQIVLLHLDFCPDS
jgi:hypothetical protein